MNTNTPWDSRCGCFSCHLHFCHLVFTISLLNNHPGWGWGKFRAFNQQIVHFTNMWGKEEWGGGLRCAIDTETTSVYWCFKFLCHFSVPSLVSPLSSPRLQSTRWLQSSHGCTQQYCPPPLQVVWSRWRRRAGRKDSHSHKYLNRSNPDF